MLGTKNGRFVVIDNQNDSWIGRWDTEGDAMAHKGEHQAMDPETDLTIYALPHNEIH